MCLEVVNIVTTILWRVDFRYTLSTIVMVVVTLSDGEQNTSQAMFYAVSY